MTKRIFGILIVASLITSMSAVAAFAQNTAISSTAISTPVGPPIVTPSLLWDMSRVVRNQARASSPLSVSKENILFSFDGVDGGSPTELTADDRGNLYGATYYGGLTGHQPPIGSNCASSIFGCGIVFELNPPAPGQSKWTERVLHFFTGGADGANPVSTLLLDHGVLYGTTTAGGIVNSACSAGCGTVFKLTPPTSYGGAWTQSTLYSFTGSKDGGSPDGTLVAAGGALFGTTIDGGLLGGGVAFKLCPPQRGRTGWDETVIHTFAAPTGKNGDGSSPESGLIQVGDALYGTTTAGGIVNSACSAGCGTVFKLVPPAWGHDTWTETLAYSFTGTGGSLPFAGLTADDRGVLYGTTSLGGYAAGCLSGGCGTVFELTPPAPGATKWKQSVLHYFSANEGYYPVSSLLYDRHGNLFGNTNLGGPDGRGLVFELSPTAQPSTPWKESILHYFTGGADGGNPANNNFLEDANGTLYSAAQGGNPNCFEGCGLVFTLTTSAKP